VYIHASIHIIHILIHRNSRLIAGFLLVFHTSRAEYGSRTVEKNCKNESRGKHALCKYGITVTVDFCSFHSQNYVVTSKFDMYFTKTAMFFRNFSPPEIRRNCLKNRDAVVAVLRERRLINRLLKKDAREPARHAALCVYGMKNLLR